jgi:immunoglobulin-like protein involved in spore germination
VDDDLKELLRDKADEMRLGQGIPQRVLRRSRRRRVLNTALAGSLAVVLGVGAFVGAKAAMGGGEQAHGGPAGQVSTPVPTPSTTPTTEPSTPPAAIVVAQPSAGDTVTSPVHIAGTADVFEAVVSIQILTGNGTAIADTTTNATCGSGCRGTYEASVPFSVANQQAGTILVFEKSAKDGSPINVVRIPVTLEPGGVVPVQNSDVWTPPSSDATDPQKTAIAFARDVMGWAPDKVHLGPVDSGSQIALDMWNSDLTSTFTHDTATTLIMHTSPTQGGTPAWSVMHAEIGVLDVTCPSNMQDALIPTDRNGQSTMEICGTLAQSNPNWTVQATVEYAASNLQPSEAESTGEIPVQGTDVHGWLPLTSTYAYPKGSLASLQVQVLDQNKNVIAEFARTLVTTG